MKLVVVSTFISLGGKDFFAGPARVSDSESAALVTADALTGDPEDIPAETTPSTGTSWSIESDAPSDSVGVNGDFQLVTGDGKIYRKAAGVYEQVGQLVVGGPAYLVYAALLTQIGTDAPVATVLENTIGPIVWTYAGSGEYNATLSGAFPANVYLFAGKPGSPNISRVNSSVIVVTGEDDLLDHTPFEIRVYL